MITVQVFGILSIIFGGVSLLPLCGIIAPIGLFLGIIGIVKKEFGTAVIGTVVSLLGMATSPILWGMTVALGCSIMHCKVAEHPKTTTSIMNPSVVSSSPTVTTGTLVNLNRVRQIYPDSCRLTVAAYKGTQLWGKTEGRWIHGEYERVATEEQCAKDCQAEEASVIQDKTYSHNVECHYGDKLLYQRADN